MERSPYIVISLLPLLCAVAALVAYFVLASDERDHARRSRKLRVSAEMAILGGIWYWLVIRFLEPSYLSGMPHLRFRQTLVAAMFAGVPWIVVLWPFALWRLERELKTPFHRLTETATRLCLATVAAFVVVVMLWSIPLFFLAPVAE